MTQASAGVGRYSATGSTDPDAVIKPRLTPATALRPIMYFHGSTQASTDTFTGAGGTGLPILLAKIVELGRVVVAGRLGTGLSNWGDSVAMARADDLYAWARSQSGYSGTKVHIIAASMGHAVACRWAAINPTKVASITGLIPVTGVQWCRDNNPTLQAQIDATWGVTYPAALPAGADPFTDAAAVAALKGIPWQGFAASDDVAAAPLVMAQAWATTVGGSATNVGALGHTDAAMGAPAFPAVARMLHLND